MYEKVKKDDEVLDDGSGIAGVDAGGSSTNILRGPQTLRKYEVVKGFWNFISRPYSIKHFIFAENV